MGALTGIMTHSGVIRMREDAEINVMVSKDLIKAGEDGGPGLYVITVTATMEEVGG